MRIFILARENNYVRNGSVQWPFSRLSFVVGAIFYQTKETLFDILNLSFLRSLDTRHQPVLQKEHVVLSRHPRPLDGG